MNAQKWKKPPTGKILCPCTRALQSLERKAVASKNMEAMSQPEDWTQYNTGSLVLAKLKAYSVKSPAKQVLQHSMHCISRPLYHLMTRLKTPMVLFSAINNLIGKSHFSPIPPKNTVFGPYSLKTITYLVTSLFSEHVLLVWTDNLCQHRGWDMYL